MKCKKCKNCKYWNRDDDPEDNKGYCEAMNDYQTVELVFIGYDGYIKTDKDFGCVLYKRGKYKKPVEIKEGKIQEVKLINKISDIEIVYTVKHDPNGGSLS